MADILQTILKVLSWMKNIVSLKLQREMLPCGPLTRNQYWFKWSLGQSLLEPLSTNSMAPYGFTRGQWVKITNGLRMSADVCRWWVRRYPSIAWCCFAQEMSWIWQNFPDEPIKLQTRTINYCDALLQRWFYRLTVFTANTLHCTYVTNRWQFPMTLPIEAWK